MIIITISILNDGPVRGLLVVLPLSATFCMGWVGAFLESHLLHKLLLNMHSLIFDKSIRCAVRTQLGSFDTRRAYHQNFIQFPK